MPAKLLIKKITEFATVPTKGSKLAAGYDLYAAYDYVVKAKGKEMIKTDLQIALPPGCYGRVAPRSGLAWKHSIDVGAGVIDEDYRGPVNVILFNFGELDFEIKRGDRVAQLICEKIEQTDIQEVDDLDNTDRGAKGFGSTGV
uniref:Deoxyuridine 5'-triphosphate nucleotidohydrolase n=1 Tax=Aceria tosichella TaxID=561515 RepID=A0A6G1SKB7_9ACAR